MATRSTSGFDDLAAQRAAASMANTRAANTLASQYSSSSPRTTPADGIREQARSQTMRAAARKSSMMANQLTPMQRAARKRRTLNAQRPSN